MLGLFLHGCNSRLFQRLYKEHSINGMRFDRICPHLLRDPLLSPMDCHVMDIDWAKLKPPKGVHFGIVPNADLGGLESNALLEVAAENVTEYEEYTLARDVLEGVHPANMEAIVDEDDGEIEVNLPQKRPHNTLSAEEKPEANAKKAKNKVSATEYLHSQKQCVTRLKWNDFEEALFSILAPRFSKGDSVDFPTMTPLWNNILKADGWFEGLQYDLNPRDRVALKNHDDYPNRKQAKQATPAEVQDMTQPVAQQATQPPPATNPTPSSAQAPTQVSSDMLLMIQQVDTHLAQLYARTACGEQLSQAGLHRCCFHHF